MSESHLKIQLLGQPLVSYNQQPVNIERTQTRSLLYFIASNEGMIGRSELIEKLFGDQTITEEIARRRLRELISKLRKDLPEPDIIQTANDQVGLDPVRVEVDALELDRIYRKTVKQLKPIRFGQALPADLLHLLETAIGFWRGSSFLQGVDLGHKNGLENWHSEKTSYYEEIREFILNHLAGHCVAVNDLESAAHWLRLALEPNQFTSLEGVCRLLKILKTVGRLNEALKIVTLVKKRFESDSEEIPQELDSICNEILNLFSSLPGKEMEDWGQSISFQIPLVGRKKELEKLNKIYQEKGMVIIWGEAGLGKTRLVNEFYRSLSPAPRLMVATCHQIEQHQPYLPLTDMLEQFITPTEWEEIDNGSLVQLERFIPNTIKSINRPITAESLKAVPGIINEAFFKVLEMAAAGNRLLLFIDNAQWCDESSLIALSYLIKKGFFNQKGFLVLTGLLSEKKPAFESFIKAINRQSNPYDVIFLETLGEKEAGQLAKHFLGYAPSAELCQKLEKESGGNPFVLVETLRWYLEKNPGKGLVEIGNDFTIPSNVSNLLRDRLKKLDQRHRLVINSAAIMGPQFNIDGVTEVSGLRKEDVVNAFETFEDIHLIKPAIKYDAIGGYNFTYPRMRTLLLNELSSARKQLLNQRMAEWLETQNGQRIARPVVLAQYYENGGNDKKAIHYWLLAAENSLALNLSSEALAAIKSAENIISRRNELFDDELIATFFNLYANYCINYNDHKSLEKISRMSFTLGQQRKSQLLVGISLRYKSLEEQKRGNLIQAVDLVNESIQHLKLTIQIHEICDANNCLGLYLLQMDNISASQKVFENNLVLAEEALTQTPSDLKLIREMGQTEINLGKLAVFEGFPRKAVTFAERAIEHLEICFNYHGLIRAQIVCAEALCLSGAFNQALITSDHALKTASSFQDDFLNASILIIFAKVNILLGNLDDGWQALNKADEISETLYSGNQKAQVHLLRGLIYHFLHNYEKSMDETQKAKSLLLNSYESTEISLNYGMILIEGNQKEEGYRIIDEALTAAQKNEFGNLSLFAEEINAIKVGDQKDYQRACVLLEDIAEKAKRRDLKLILLNAYYYYGIYAFEKGDYSVAHRLAQTVIGLGRHSKNVWIEISGLVLLYKTNQFEGHPDEGSLKRVAKILDEIRMQTAEEPLRSELDRFSWEMINQLGL